MRKNPNVGAPVEGIVHSEGHHDGSKHGHRGGPGGHGHAGLQRPEVEPGRQGDRPGRRGRLHPRPERRRLQAEVGPQTTMVPIKKSLSKILFKISI